MKKNYSYKCIQKSDLYICTHVILCLFFLSFFYVCVHNETALKNIEIVRKRKNISCRLDLINNLSTFFLKIYILSITQVLNERHIESL